VFSGKSVASARFCLPHGRLADPLLANHLREQGGSVEEWTLYDTEAEQEDPTGARARYLREGAHWITFTSSSTAENWHALRLQPARARRGRKRSAWGRSPARPCANSVMRSRRIAGLDPRRINRDYSEIKYRIAPCRRLMS